MIVDPRSEETKKRIQSRYDGFRDRLGDAVQFKMKAEGKHCLKLAEELDISIASLSQIRQGSDGSRRSVPNLEVHFRVLDYYLESDLEIVTHVPEMEATINDVWDVVMRLKIPAKARSQMAEVLTVMWENNV